MIPRKPMFLEISCPAFVEQVDPLIAGFGGCFESRLKSMFSLVPEGKSGNAKLISL